MTIPRRRFLAISAAAALVPAGPGHAVTRWQGQALGADVDIVLHGPDMAAAAALELCRRSLARSESLFSLYDAGSALSRLNAEKRLDPAPAEMIELLAICNRIHGATYGRFDPTVQPLWRAHADGRETEAARLAVGWSGVALGERSVAIGETQALTLNGIAQGHATDDVARILGEMGFEKALIHLGEHRAIGGPFRLELIDPVLGGFGQRSVTDGAIATSSPGALLLPDGIAHIMDPTERAIGPYWSTVSVESASATFADGLSTAFCLMSRGEIERARQAFPDIRRITLIGPAGDLVTL